MQILTGQQFNRWTVLEFAYKKKANYYWLCQCSCDKHTIKIVYGGSLKHNKSQSCGCLAVEAITAKLKIYNNYILTGEYGVGHTTNTNKEFYFDLEDYDKIKNYAWRENDQGYIVTTNKRKSLRLHRLILNLQYYNKEQDNQVDHIYHLKYDNRKSQLRICTNQQNSFNRNIKGVYYDKSRNKWVARLQRNNKLYLFKRCDTEEEAIFLRKKAEEECFGEFQYQSK